MYYSQNGPQTYYVYTDFFRIHITCTKIKILHLQLNYYGMKGVLIAQG
jgi:hypothetical protein